MRGLWRSRSRFKKALIIIFLLTLPFIRRQIQPDGQGYYAYLRSPLIDHNFNSQVIGMIRRRKCFCFADRARMR